MRQGEHIVSDQLIVSILDRYEARSGICPIGIGRVLIDKLRRQHTGKMLLKKVIDSHLKIPVD